LRLARAQSVPRGHQLVRGRELRQFFRSGLEKPRSCGESASALGNDFFGEIGLLETARRTASVVATTPMEVIVMFQPEFEQMKKELPTVADQVQAAIRARLEA
jgi:CRP-like cAMP-binding protein